MYNEGKPVGVESLKEVSIDSDPGLVRMTESLANLLMEVMTPFRALGSPMADGVCMTTLACCIGIIQGEMEAKGIVPELSDGCRDKLLIENYKAGIDIGRQSVTRKTAKAN